MSQNACFTPLFNLSDFIYFSTNSMPISKASGRWVFKFCRPSIPIVGMVDNTTKDSIANNVTFFQTFADFFTSAFECSSQMTVPGSFPDNEYDSLLWQQYFYKLLQENLCNQQRVLQNSGIVLQFWLNVNLAWTNEEYYNAIEKLKDDLSNHADKGLFIPPGTYTIDNASALALALDAWVAVTPTLSFMTLEHYQSNS